MIVIVDERELVTDGFGSLFGREGVASAGFRATEFGDWMDGAAADDLKAIRASINAL